MSTSCPRKWVGRVFFLHIVTGLWLGIVCCWGLVEFSSYILVYGWGVFAEVWSSFLPTYWSMAGECLLLRFGRVFFLHTGLWLGSVCCWGLVKFSSYILVWLGIVCYWGLVEFSSYILVYGWGLFVEVWSSFLPVYSAFEIFLPAVSSTPYTVCCWWVFKNSIYMLIAEHLFSIICFTAGVKASCPMMCNSHPKMSRLGCSLFLLLFYILRWIIWLSASSMGLVLGEKKKRKITEISLVCFRKNGMDWLRRVTVRMRVSTDAALLWVLIDK